MRAFIRRIAKAVVPPVENDLDQVEAVALVREGMRLPITEDGREVVDPTPMAPPVGYRRQPSMVEIVRQMVRSERLRAEAEAADMETFEESDDFDVGDDFDPTSPYENEFDPPIREMVQEGRKAQEKRKRSSQAPIPPEQKESSQAAD